MSIIPEPLRTRIDEAAQTSRDMNIPNNDDLADDDCTVEDSADSE